MSITVSSDDIAEGEVTIIPYTTLSKETLDSLVSEFILREGTDYGDAEIDFTQKMEQLHRRLKQGDIKISFCHDSNSCNLVS